MQKKIFFCLLMILTGRLFVVAQQNSTAAEQTDVLHYTFGITVSDENNSIKGEALVTARFLRNASELRLNLTAKNPVTGKGMTVISVQENGKALSFSHSGDTLAIACRVNGGETKTIAIQYEGIPADGLIISKNKYNHRTIFGDNWPDRAHNWIPCKDYPADKAAVDFIVTAPDHYQVISNGLKIEETNLAGNLKRTHWSETIALPTKVMVVGLADFAVNYSGDVDCIPVYSWVYPEDRDPGFADYALAKKILPWFIKNIGPYPYRKLANVQSKTQFGGMENASAIFYTENSVKGDGTVEALLTHEIAHQWFGNSATEVNWHHVWLSEGFATYMTHLYLENTYGTDTLNKRMKIDREAVVAFSRTRNSGVVDTTINDHYMRLLNANSYQKGGWVLHMLRQQLGDSLFRRGIRNYYAAYAGKNASTEDFEKIMETVSRQDLRQFFHQWLYTPGQPDLDVQWRYNGAAKTIQLTIIQNQPALFSFPFEVSVVTGKSPLKKTIAISEKSTTITISSASKPREVILDPDTKLLFKGSVIEVSPA